MRFLEASSIRICYLVDQTTSEIQQYRLRLKIAPSLVMLSLTYGHSLFLHVPSFILTSNVRFIWKLLGG